MDKIETMLRRILLNQAMIMLAMSEFELSEITKAQLKKQAEEALDLLKTLN